MRINLVHVKSLALSKLSLKNSFFFFSTFRMRFDGTNDEKENDERLNCNYIPLGTVCACVLCIFGRPNRSISIQLNADSSIEEKKKNCYYAIRLLTTLIL